MAKDPAFLFYPADASEDTQFMNRLERGAYFDILKAQKRFGKFSKDQIKKVLGNDFDSCWPALELVLKLEDGFYFIEWVAEKIEERRKYSASRSKNRAPKEDTASHDTHINNICETYVEDMVIENEIENTNVLKGVQGENEMPIGFQMQQAFCLANPAYPQKPSSDMPAIMDIASFIYLQQKGKSKEMFEFDVGEKKLVMDEWVKWCKWYKMFGNDKSLDFLAKFKMQEIHLNIKNNLVKNETDKRAAAGKLAGGKQSAGANELLADLEAELRLG